MEAVGGVGRGGLVNVSDGGPFIGQLTPLIAPLRFSLVAHPVDISANSPVLTQSIYRGAFPHRRNIPFLSRLRLKTVLSLTPKPLEVLDKAVADWAKSSGVSLVHVKCEKPKDDGGGLSKEAAGEALLHLLDSRQLPLYIHCLDGQGVSTLLVAILRRVQAWSIRAIVDEISRSLGQDEEVLQYQVGFVEKFGKPDGVLLPSRRFIPDWTWTDPSPLKRLKDPYDVIVAAKEKANNDRGSHAQGHKQETSGDVLPLSGAASPSALTYGVGTLPIQHPTLRLRFELDPKLPPPPPHPPSSSSLSSVTSQPHSTFHSRESSNLFSPSSSRPSSRTGRISTHSHALHPHHYHSDMLRSNSRPGSSQGSPRRKVSTAEQSPNLSNKLLSLPTSPSSSHLEFIGANLANENDLPVPEDEEGHDTDWKGNKSRSPDEKGLLHSSSRRSSFGSSTPTRPSHLSNGATPRASGPLSKAVKPVSSRGALHGLGLHADPHVQETQSNEEERVDPHRLEGEPLGAHLSHQTADSETSAAAHRPVALRRSISEAIPVLKRHEIDRNSDEVISEEEYYSEPEELERKQREEEEQQQQSTESFLDSSHRKHGSQSSSFGNEIAGKDEEEADEDGESEEDDEEEDEDDEDEEEDDDDDDDDDAGLALEALDLEGY
ncbi:hypothetical protein CBS101457_001889 [Exobasidium rhododendri]|nr:hypothetical protein CBS101457_001889 [Exobasidium rhododendri]